MFNARYFNPRYWAKRFWPKVGAGQPFIDPGLTEGVITLPNTDVPVIDSPSLITKIITTPVDFPDPITDNGKAKVRINAEIKKVRINATPKVTRVK